MPPSKWDEVPPEHRSMELEPQPPRETMSANPGMLLKAGSSDHAGASPSLEEMLNRLHRDIMQRFDQQDSMLHQVSSRVSTPAVRKAAMPVIQMASNSEASGTSSVGKSPGSGSNSLSSWAAEDNPRKSTSKRSNRSGKKKPTLFSTFTQFDLGKKATAMNAEETYASEDPASMEFKEPWAKRFVGNPRFDAFFALVVITNSIFIGVDVQINPSAYGLRQTPIMIFQGIYTFLFTLELIFRFAAYGKQLFCGSEWAWGALDVFIVFSSWWEVFVDVWYMLSPDESQFDSFGGLTGLKAFRIVRLTRIVKTVRLMRIFRFVLALRTLIHSILHTPKSLFWALVLLVLIVYVFALIFTQSVADHCMEYELPPAHDEASLVYFGSLLTTMLSLFMTVTDGVSWEKVIAPLEAISPVWAFFFLFYVAFTYFAVLNVLTGVFCQSAIESAQNDHATAVQSMIANKEAHLTKVRLLFNQLGSDENSVITFRQFEEKINSDEVREYFETLGLDVWDAWSFFKLLDRDGGGSVEIEEFLKGCLRFRGQARAIDIGQLIHDQEWLIKNQGRFQTYMELELGKLKKQLTALTAVLANVPVAFPESPNLRDSPGVGAARGAPPGGLRKALEEAVANKSPPLLPDAPVKEPSRVSLE